MEQDMISRNPPTRSISSTLSTSNDAASSSSGNGRSRTLDPGAGLARRERDPSSSSRNARSAPPALARDSENNEIPQKLDAFLTERYGSIHPARAKLGRLAIQNTEFDPADVAKPKNLRRTRVNPTRLRIAKTAEKRGQPPTVRIASQTSNGFLEGSLAEHIDLDALRNGEVPYKWTLSSNGTLFVGESNPVDPQKGVRRKMGHPTLVGGMIRPEARFGGILRYDKDNDEFVIDNDSGRFSEHEELTPEHLANVAALFKEAGLEVGTRWKKMSGR
jgi:hypothetical protein